MVRDGDCKQENQDFLMFLLETHGNVSAENGNMSLDKLPRFSLFQLATYEAEMLHALLG